MLQSAATNYKKEVKALKFFPRLNWKLNVSFSSVTENVWIVPHFILLFLRE